MSDHKEAKAVGRPTDYTQELVDEICEKIATGDSMRSVCRCDDMPAMTTLFRWLREKEGFKKQYEIATQERTEAMSEDIIDIADNGTNDWMKTHGKDDEGYKQNGETLQRSRLRVDVRKWHMSKMKPKKYGDKIQQEISDTFGLESLCDFSEYPEYVPEESFPSNKDG